MRETATTSEMLMNFFQAARRCNPEVSHLLLQFLSVIYLPNFWLHTCFCIIKDFPTASFLFLVIVVY
jgi:hypothetical protein